MFYTAQTTAPYTASAWQGSWMESLLGPDSVEIVKDGYPRFGVDDENDKIASLNSAASTDISLGNFEITGSIALLAGAAYAACTALLTF